LQELRLWNNRIGDQGTRLLSALTNLRWLDLDENNIGAEGVGALLDNWLEAPPEHLLVLDLSRNRDDLTSVLPAEVLETKDARAIVAAYRRYRTAAEQNTLRALNESKLLVVGAEAVGKTSLIRYLVRNEARNPDEPKTPGTAVHEKIETQTWSPERSRVRLNVWDFGGQEIMHGTHRFFLTERSLYLLVLWDRLEDDRSVYDWLRTIRNRGGDSPVIVVINKCDDGVPKLRLEETKLRREHPAIVDFVYTSCEATEYAAASIARLREVIAETLVGNERLKHVRDPIPHSWLRVKEAVSERAREQRVLPIREFERLCEERAGVNDDAILDPDEQRALLRLLHDLGVVVAHGLRREAPAALREITLLDPNWLTSAIYTLLNSATVRDQGGEFSHTQLRELLDPQVYPAGWHEFMLDMMQDPEVGLCFEIPGSRRERYLIPEALPANEPDYGMWPADSLQFRFSYELLPRRLVPRFIVQAHRNLTQRPTRWRTGVVLGAAGCQILVRGDRDRQRLDISIAGPEGLQRSALNIVLDDLDEVHALNPEIGAKALVPLTDQPELDVPYEHLLTLEQRRGLDHEFDPPGADRPYTVRELLEGVRRYPANLVQQTADRKGRDIKIGDYAQITMINGGFQGGDPASWRGPVPATAPPSGTWLSWFSSWRFFSIACGAGAVAVATILMMLPSDKWHAILGGLLGLLLLVTAFMLSLNPQFFYRRLLSYVIPGGLLLGAAGFSVDAFAGGDLGVGSLRWNNEVNGWFFAAWAIVVGCLVLGDLKQSR
jgi:internalin A